MPRNRRLTDGCVTRIESLRNDSSPRLPPPTASSENSAPQARHLPLHTPSCKCASAALKPEGDDTERH